MNAITTTLARILFAVPFLGFGLLHLAAGPAMAGAVPVPGGVFWVYFTGVCLLAAGVAIASNRLGKWAALGLAALLLVFVFTMHIPALGNPQTQQMAVANLLKDVGLCGAALTWAGIFARQEKTAASGRPVSRTA